MVPATYKHCIFFFFYLRKRTLLLGGHLVIVPATYKQQIFNLPKRTPLLGEIFSGPLSARLREVPLYFQKHHFFLLSVDDKTRLRMS